MHLYLVTAWDGEIELDEYDSFVVAAESEDAARLVNPNGCDQWIESSNGADWVDVKGKSATTTGHGWPPPMDVRVEFIGVAEDGIEGGSIICASFNSY